MTIAIPSRMNTQTTHQNASKTTLKKSFVLGHPDDFGGAIKLGSLQPGETTNYYLHSKGANFVQPGTYTADVTFVTEDGPTKGLTLPTLTFRVGS